MSKKSQHVDESRDSSRLPKLFSNLKPNIHLLHLLVLRQLSNGRAGTASTKTRAEVRGGGAKPWKQKGTGRARVGSIRSPLWVGGGIAFGPKPRSYKFNISKKARNLGIAQAIALKSDDLVVLKKLPEIKDSKTKIFINEIKALNLSKTPILFVANKEELYYQAVKRASRNLPYLTFKEDNFLGVYDLLKAQSVVITEGALNSIEKRCSDFFKRKENKVA